MSRRIKHERPFGSIRPLASGRFQVRYTVDGVEYTGPHTFDTKRRAEGWLGIKLAELQQDSWHDPTVRLLTVSDYALHWLEEHQGLRPRTRALYESQITRFIVDPPIRAGETTACPDLGDMLLRDVRPKHVGDWYRWVRDLSQTAAEARLHPQEGSLRVKPDGVVYEGDPSLGVVQVVSWPMRAGSVTSSREFAAVRASRVRVRASRLK
ncbi:N-terminal phage integrase SAM-like domain-containing protein [Ornithinibacter aureus]|uniref:N-terminal phage integrase SAM-like domain-containing protein n=1 Tax=Ornithinibacter aureus TaxID=622664 RepID=UPI00135A1ED7|nr:N-terminal phage integrase SAM-like domain-containing protein [Ornithinibacter aureus]KAF0834677.1 hypothetical protein C8E84_2511 [Ornithinibacter aureus]